MKATGFLGSRLSTIVCGSLNSRSESLSAKAPQVLISGQAGALDRPEESEAGLKLEDQSDAEDSALLPTQDQGPQLKVAEKILPIRKLTDSHDTDFKSLWKR